MTPVKKPVSRWIVVATVRRRFIVMRNCGFPNGIVLFWRGKIEWCQPSEFLQWDQVDRAVRIRLGIAKLRTLAIACKIDRSSCGEIDLLCEVGRLLK